MSSTSDPSLADTLADLKEVLRPSDTPLPPPRILTPEEIAKLESEGDIDVTPLEVSDEPEMITSPTTEYLQRQSLSHLDTLKPNLEQIEAIKAERINRSKFLNEDSPSRLKAPFSPHPSHRRKNITLRYLPKDIGQPIIDLICKRYTEHVPLEHIIKQVNTRIRIDNLIPITLIDLYAVLTDQAAKKNIKQRRQPSNELTLIKFSAFFDAWRNGLSFVQCKEKVVPFTNTYFLQKCHRSMQERIRVDRKREEAASISQEAVLTIKNVDQTILCLATKQIVDNTSCLVIPIRKLPTHLLLFLKEIPNAAALIESAQLTQEQVDIHLITDPTGASLPPPKLNLRKPTAIEEQFDNDPLIEEELPDITDADAKFIPEPEDEVEPSVFDNEEIGNIQSESEDPFAET